MRFLHSLAVAVIAHAAGVAPRAEAQTAADNHARCADLLYETTFDKTPSGSKPELIAAVDRGEQIRLGWELDFDGDGARDIAHWSDAAFLTVFEDEVFAQVDAIHAQRPVRGSKSVALPTEFAEWRGMLSTTGALSGAFSDGRAFPPDLRARILWCGARPRPTPSVVLYRHSADGEPIAGAKEELIAAVSAGLPIQIGWGFARERDDARIALEHLAAPIFISVLGEDEVVAQLPEHIAQRSYWDADGPYFDDPAVMWRGLMTTKGAFDAVWVNRATGDVVRRWPQRAALTWYAPARAPRSTPSLATPGGVTRDADRAGEIVPQ